MKKKIIPLIAAAYLAVAMVAFGHAWNNGDWDNHGQQMIGSPACAVLWPLYASAQAFKL